MPFRFPFTADMHMHSMCGLGPYMLSQTLLRDTVAVVLQQDYFHSACPWLH